MGTSRTEQAVNVVLVVTCLLVSAVAVERLWLGDASRRSASAPEYVRGEILPALSSVHYAEKEKTVVLFLSPRCQFCTASMPFYAKLSALRQAKGFQMVVIGGESELTLSQYLASHELKVDRIQTIRQGEMKVAATPTLILADRHGRVERVWRGALRDRESQVEEALQTK